MLNCSNFDSETVCVSWRLSKFEFEARALAATQWPPPSHLGRRPERTHFKLDSESVCVSWRLSNLNLEI